MELGYREVIPDQTAAEKWNEFFINTGGTQSTLQDIKVAERSGGYAYKNQSKYFTRNRFIYWRLSHDILELVEESLDVNLTGNRVRYRFIDTAILEGITIHETCKSVSVLVATVSSVHRLTFPHPDVIHNQEHAYPRLDVEYSAKSIFAEATIGDARSPSSFYVINNASTNSPLPHTSATGVSHTQQHFLFALAYNTGVVLLVIFDPVTGHVSCLELRQQYDALIMPRFLSRALRGKSNEEEMTVSMLFHEIASETYLFCLCRDGNVRLWSTSRTQCSVITDVGLAGNEGAQYHMLRKAVAPDQENFCLAVLLGLATHSVIHVLKPIVEGSTFRLRPTSSVYTPKDQDVVDFTVTYEQEIWAVFRSPQGETSVSFWKGTDWIPCILENPLDRVEIPLDVEIDFKQNFIDFIFHPGRFPVSVINKALSIYRKSNIITDVGVPVHVLKERVCAVVDAEFNAETQGKDYGEEEAVELMNSCWQKFYSCCVEYYESGTRPIGLLLLSHHVPRTSCDGSLRNDSKAAMEINLDNESESSDSEGPDKEDLHCGEFVTSGAVIIKKSYISLIRPMDSLETISLNPRIRIEDLRTAIDLFDGSISKDVFTLVKMLTYLDDNLPDDLKMFFDKSMRHLKSPLMAISEMFANELCLGDEDTLTNLDLLFNIAVNIERIQNVEAVMVSLLDLVDVGQPDLNDGYDRIENTKWLIHLGHLYGSQLAMSFVATSSQQIVVIRYELCRCLLILQRLLVTNAFQQFLSSSPSYPIGENVLERTASLTSCYYILVWMSQTSVHVPLLLESSENSVSVLKLNEANKGFAMQKTHHQPARNMTLLHFFLQSTASSTIRLLLSKREIPQAFICLWHQTLLPYVHMLTQLVWPICNNTIFPEFLLCTGQYVHVQEYTRLLSKWCHSNSYTRKFLLGCALLDSGEHYKAFDVFQKAAHGVSIDHFIRCKVLKQTLGVKKERLIVLYYLKVIKLFEQHSSCDVIIDLAKHAIQVAEQDDPELPTLYSLVFLNHIQVGQYKEAYDSLVANPDSDRRKDCLRQLVVNLFEARMLNTLINFTFDGMHDDLERIIEGRARSLDVINNEYYNFLFAFHALRGSMRKAASVMYEQALRLSAESLENNIKALEKQSRCYTAAITSLSLVNGKEAWIVKPLPGNDDVNSERMSKGRMKHQVEVVELKDMLKEHCLCRAKLKLIKFSPEHYNKMSSALSAHELVGVLTNVGLYKDALTISTLFGFPAGSVLAGLAMTCVRLDENQMDSAWDWLPENDVSDLGDGCASNLAWRLLRLLLEKHESDGDSQLHRAVTSKLLQLGVFVPHWLVTSFKSRNCAQLLRLLLENGRLEESAVLALEVVDAVLGKGKERFNMDTSILPQNPPTWLPLGTIDTILQELETQGLVDAEYKQVHSELSGAVDRYLKTAMSVSQDKIAMVHREISQLRSF